MGANSNTCPLQMTVSMLAPAVRSKLMFSKSFKSKSSGLVQELFL